MIEVYLHCSFIDMRQLLRTHMLIMKLKCINTNLILQMILELCITSLEGGRNHGFDPPLREVSFKSSLTCGVSKPILKVG